MICNAKLSNSSLTPAKLKEHFSKLHGDVEYKNTTLAEFKVKRARFNERPTLPALGFVPVNKPILTASYEVAYLIAKQGKPLREIHILMGSGYVKKCKLLYFVHWFKGTPHLFCLFVLVYFSFELLFCQSTHIYKTALNAPLVCDKNSFVRMFLEGDWSHSFSTTAKG